MDDLNRALGDIRSIRRQMAHTTEFRGYGPVTLTATAALALFGALAQALLVPDPAAHPAAYIAVWVATASAAAVLMAWQTVARTRRMHSGLADEMLRMAIQQFVPAVVAGALLTIVIERAVPAAIWMLPGLWQIIFSLGIFSSCRFLPKPMVSAAVWFLVTGLACLSLGNSRALSPFAMGGAYLVGQMLVAGVMYFMAEEAGDEA